MAVYTTELRNVIRVAETQAHGSYTEFEYTDATWRALGLDAYPIYDESHRHRLNSMICDHFYMREIGAETVSLFRLFLRRTMNEIMPYYNDLYMSAELIVDPLREIDVTTTHDWEENEVSSLTSDQSTQSSANDKTTDTLDQTVSTDESVSRTRTDTSTGTVKVDQDGSSNSIYSDTPMSMVQDDGGTLIEGGSYATNATFDKSTNDSTTTNDLTNASDGSDKTSGTVDTDSTRDTTSTRSDSSQSNRTDSGKNDTTGNRTENESGHRSSQASLVMEYRRAIINVDHMILEDPELNSCFMCVY